MALRICRSFRQRALNSSKQIWQSQEGRAFSKDISRWDGTGSPLQKPITNMPPLNEPVPGLPRPKFADLREEHQSTEITVLSNGLTVASENRFGEFCTVGVVIDSGSRYEVAFPSGISHFLEKLAFNSTLNYPDKNEMLKNLERHGGICDSQGSRDTLIYAASANTSGLDDVIELLGEVVLQPQITDDEVEAAKQTISFELQMLNMRPEQETLLMDMIHAVNVCRHQENKLFKQVIKKLHLIPPFYFRKHKLGPMSTISGSAAYRDNTLGLPKLCPPNNLNKINRNVLFTYLNLYHTPKRMVVAGVGVEHQKLVDAVEKHFVSKKPIWEENTSLLIRDRSLTVDKSIAQYTGGMIMEECDIPQFASAGLPILSHVMLGLEGCSHQDPDFIPMCVLNMMMGGGGSFSAGGPGKGMYTRLYTNVLNRHHWMYSATAYNHAYSDSGLFCIHASAPPGNMREMVEVTVKEMVSMSGSMSEQELKRAKTQLQSMLLMNLESRPVIFEDIGRQVLATGERKRPEHFIKEIEKVSKDNVVAVAQRLLSSQPAVAARGDLKNMPSLEYIQAGFLDSEGRMPGGRRMSLF